MENYFAMLHGQIYDTLKKNSENREFVTITRWFPMFIEEDYQENLYPNHSQYLNLLTWKNCEFIGRRRTCQQLLDIISWKELYNDHFPEDPWKRYKVYTLPPKFRAWHKSLLGCQNPRPHSNSADYVLVVLSEERQEALLSFYFPSLSEEVNHQR